MKHTGRRLLTAALLALALAETSGATTLAQTAPPTPAPVSNISSFACTEGEAQYYTVPPNTNWLAITAWGGSGMSVSGAAGGHGAAVNARVPVTPGQRLAVTVGCAGGAVFDSRVGFAAGGAGGRADLDVKAYGGDGGGASGVQLCPGTSTCDTPGAKEGILVVAGGAGGGGGKSVEGDGGNGGSGSASGDKGRSGDACLICSSASGGGGGASQLANGNGANGWGTTDAGAGGGGGGGYPRGGDGGRGGSCVGCGGGGGGGGASYTISTATDVKIVDGGAQRGNGLVILTPVRPTQPVPTITEFPCSTGKLQTYTVPSRVTSIGVVAVGAQGGPGDNLLGGFGGAGAVVSGMLAASPGQQFGVLPGCSNGGNSGAGFGSGGRGGANNVQERAGGGGGGSAVLSTPSMSANPLLVAGGGGGAGDGQYSGSGGYNPLTELDGQRGEGTAIGSGASGGVGGGTAGRDGTNGQGSDCAHGGGGGGGGYPKGGTGGHSGGCIDGSGGGGGAGQSFNDASVQSPTTTRGGGGTSGGLVLMIAPLPGPPMAPTNVVATGTDRGATVTFTIPADNGGVPITSYTVRSTPGKFSINVGAAKLGPVVFAGLTNGTAYTFTVIATNAVGDSLPSAPSNPVTPRPFPGQPRITSVTAGDGQGTVAFSPPTVGAPFTSYTVTARDGGRITGPGITATGSTSPIAVTGLTNGTTYILTVYATNSSGNGPESPVSSVAPLGLPGAPTNVQATADIGVATISFTPPANTGGAQFLRYTVTSSPGGITGSGNNSPIQLSGLTNGVAYTFTVYASNAAGNGPLSTPSNSVTPTSNVVPTPPLLPHAAAGDGQATVSFQTPLSDGGAPIASYSVTSNPGGFTATGTASPITVTGLNNGTSYTFTVVATNAVGNSQPSSASNAVTPGGATIPSVPGAPVAFASNEGALVRVSRPDSEGFSPITSYTVTSNPGGITAIGYGDANPVAVSGLTNGVSYTFTVVATNAVGDSLSSAASNPITPSGSLAPANDNFNNAQVIGGSGSVTGTNVNATTEAGEPGLDSGGASVWYVWAAPQGGVLQIDTCGSSFTPLVTVYTGSSLNALTRLATSVVPGSCGGSSGSVIQVNVSPNSGTLYFAVDGGLAPTGPVEGDFNLHWGQGG